MRRILTLFAGIVWSAMGVCDPPTVQVTYPPANLTISKAQSPAITLQASAADADEAIIKVLFFACPATGSSCDAAAETVGAATTSPYQTSWTPPHVVTIASVSTRYLVWALASNALGQQTSSAKVPVTMIQPAPGPSVKLVAPSASIGFATPAAPVLYATASPNTTTPPSTIVRVDFLDGQDVIGSVASPNSVPGGYAYTWTNPALGAHQIAARASDSLGNSSTSGPVTIYIFAASRAPQVALTAPASGQTYNGTSTIPLAAAVTRGDRAIQRVEFVAGNKVVATVFAPPYTANWVGPSPGNYAIAARVFDDLGVAVASPAAYLWVSKDPRPPAVVMTAPAPGSAVPASSPLTLAATALAPDGAIGRVDFYAGKTMLGSAPSAPTAPYSFVWPKPTVGAQSMTARAYDLQGRSAVSTAVPITVNNKLPVVALTAPAPGTRVAAPAIIALSASASEPGGSIARVEFYANGALVATQATPPYNATWKNVPAGEYSLAAKAIDATGSSQLSTAVSVSVINNAAPTVAMTAPSNGQTAYVGQPVTLTATAADADGNLSKVEFFVDGASVGTVGSSPFTRVWVPVSAGTHAVQARATDNLGAMATSSQVSIVVTANGAPTAALVSPTNNQSFAAGQPITMTATASDPDGTVVKLEFLADGAVVGSTTAPPFSRTWSGATVGVHVLSVRATDNAGAISTSAPVTVLVNAGNPPAVSLTSPSAGDVISAGTPVALSASASSAAGAIARVDFYGNSTLIGSATMAPFSLTWTAPAPGTYSIFAKATDTQGTVATSASASIRVITPALTIDSPGAGAAVGADFVLVSGTLQAPTNSGITVNGVVAENDGLGHYAANNVPLLSGANTVTVTLTTGDGQTITKTGLVNSTAAAPFQLYADPDTDFAPATFTIRVRNRGGIPIASLTYANLGGGQFDGASFDQEVLGTISYTVPGFYTPQFTVTDASGAKYTQTVALQVHDSATLDQTLKRLWTSFSGALAAGDIPRATSFFSLNAHARYDSVLTRIAPALRTSVAGWGQPQTALIAGEIADYWVSRNVDGVDRAYLIYFLRSPDGVWQLDSM